MAVVADVDAIVIMAGRVGRCVLVVMGMAVMVNRNRGNVSQAGRVGDVRAEPQHRERQQADQQGPDGRDSRPHHCNPYRRTPVAR